MCTSFFWYKIIVHANQETNQPNFKSIATEKYQAFYARTITALKLLLFNFAKFPWKSSWVKGKRTILIHLQRQIKGAKQYSNTFLNFLNLFSNFQLLNYFIMKYTKTSKLHRTIIAAVVYSKKIKIFCTCSDDKHSPITWK